VIKIEDNDKIEFGDLNTWCKLGVAGGMIYLALLVLGFIAGFFIGIGGG